MKLKDIKKLFVKPVVLEINDCEVKGSNPNEIGIGFMWENKTNNKYDDHEVELIYINSELEELVIKLK